MKKKESLVKLIKTIVWKEMEKRYAGTRNFPIPPDKLKIICSRTSKNIEIVNRIGIKLRLDTVKKLGWKDKDRINVLNDSDHLLRFNLLPNDKGYMFRIIAEKTGYLQIKWPYHSECPLEKTTKLLDYEIYKNQLLFQL